MTPWAGGSESLSPSRAPRPRRSASSGNFYPSWIKGWVYLPRRYCYENGWIRWLQEVIIPYRRQNTKERYQGIIRLHIVPAIGHIELSKLAPSHIQAMESKLSNQGMTPKGVSMVHMVISGAMKHALRMELIYRNPVSLVSPPPQMKRETRPPEIAAVREALELAKYERNDLAACIHLIAYTGLRRGEALGLKWENVNLDGGYVQIVASLIKSRERGLILEPPKTDSGRRRVDLDADTIDVLRQHRDWQEGVRGIMRETFKNQGIVFAGAYGEWTNPAMLTRAVKSLGKRVSYQGMTVRSLRHFHASIALQTGQNIVVVSKRLGHANVSITSDIYAHALPGWQKQAAEAFAQAMRKGD